MQALIAASYEIYAINPLQVARYRDGSACPGQERHRRRARLGGYGAHRRHQLRRVAGDSAPAEAVKVLTRAHKTLIWERTRHLLRLRHALREFFPAALVAFDDLTAAETLELLGVAPDPATPHCIHRRGGRRRST